MVLSFCLSAQTSNWRELWHYVSRKVDNVMPQLWPIWSLGTYTMQVYTSRAARVKMHCRQKTTRDNRVPVLTLIQREETAVVRHTWFFKHDGTIRSITAAFLVFLWFKIMRKRQNRVSRVSLICWGYQEYLSEASWWWQ